MGASAAARGKRPTWVPRAGGGACAPVEGPGVLRSAPLRRPSWDPGAQATLPEAGETPASGRRTLPPFPFLPVPGGAGTAPGPGRDGAGRLPARAAAAALCIPARGGRQPDTPSRRPAAWPRARARTLRGAVFPGWVIGEAGMTLVARTRPQSAGTQTGNNHPELNLPTRTRWKVTPHPFRRRRPCCRERLHANAFLPGSHPPAHKPQVSLVGDPPTPSPLQPQEISWTQRGASHI